jgi:hypothetical protein
VSDPSERLKKWFANHYNRDQFRLSMGEIRFETAGTNALVGFLAQGVALSGFNDVSYLCKLIDLHGHLSSMIEDLQKIPGHDSLQRYHYALILGVLIGQSLQAVAELHQQENDHG